MITKLAQKCYGFFIRQQPFSTVLGFPGHSDSKESACSVGDQGSIPGSGRFPEEGNGNPLQYSCLENPMVGETRWGRKELDVSECLTHKLP